MRYEEPEMEIVELDEETYTATDFLSLSAGTDGPGSDPGTHF